MVKRRSGPEVCGEEAEAAGAAPEPAHSCLTSIAVDPATPQHRAKRPSSKTAAPGGMRGSPSRGRKDVLAAATRPPPWRTKVHARAGATGDRHRRLAASAPVEATGSGGTGAAEASRGGAGGARRRGRRSVGRRSRAADARVSGAAAVADAEDAEVAAVARGEGARRSRGGAPASEAAASPRRHQRRCGAEVAKGRALASSRPRPSVCSAAVDACSSSRRRSRCASSSAAEAALEAAPEAAAEVAAAPARAFVEGGARRRRLRRRAPPALVHRKLAHRRRRLRRRRPTAHQRRVRRHRLRGANLGAQSPPPSRRAPPRPRTASLEAPGASPTRTARRSPRPPRRRVSRARARRRTAPSSAATRRRAGCRVTAEDCAEVSRRCGDGGAGRAASPSWRCRSSSLRYGRRWGSGRRRSSPWYGAIRASIRGRGCHRIPALWRAAAERSSLERWCTTRVRAVRGERFGAGAAARPPPLGPRRPRTARRGAARAVGGGGREDHSDDGLAPSASAISLAFHGELYRRKMRTDEGQLRPNLPSPAARRCGGRRGRGRRRLRSRPRRSSPRRCAARREEMRGRSRRGGDARRARATAPSAPPRGGGGAAEGRAPRERLLRYSSCTRCCGAIRRTSVGSLLFTQTVARISSRCALAETTGARAPARRCRAEAELVLAQDHGIREHVALLGEHARRSLTIR